MSIVIFGDMFTFPEGQAATNRVHSYAKGFIENGINVHVISFLSDYTEKTNGVINGIHYYYPFTPKKRSKHFIVRRWKNLVKHLNTYILIRKINREDKVIAVNSWSNLLATHLFAHLLSMLCRSKLIIESSEHPLRFYQGSALKRKQGQIKLIIESGISDGVFCISNFLMELYKAKGVSKRKLFHVPSTVDPERFSKICSERNTTPYIGYFGSLTFSRDNIDLLVRSFARLSTIHTEMQLVLGGFCSDSERRQLLELINKLNIQSKVQVLEYLTREEILTYISQAYILVMVRSNDLQSKASYPSKLTEFLASSKPVITVNVGEISLYLSDGINAFLIEPENEDALYQKLDYVIRNYEIARKVGRNGRQLTETVFNYKYQADRMIVFIKSLEKN